MTTRLEPVAWRTRRRNHVRAGWNYTGIQPDASLSKNYEVQPLYAAAAPAPDGMRERLVQIGDDWFLDGDPVHPNPTTDAILATKGEGR